MCGAHSESGRTSERARGERRLEAITMTIAMTRLKFGNACGKGVDNFFGWVFPQCKCGSGLTMVNDIHKAPLFYGQGLCLSWLKCISAARV